MKNSKVLGVFLSGLTVVSSMNAFASDLDVDVLFVVEPKVFTDGHTREEVGHLLESQVENANEVHSRYSTGVHYRIAAVVDWKDNSVSEKLAQGDSLSVASANVLSSVRYDEKGFADNADFAMTQYEPEMHEMVNQFHADKVVFVAAQGSASEVNQDVVATALQNYGVVSSVDGLDVDKYLLAHEWGHNIGLGHPSSESCASFFSVMCQGAHYTVDGFSDNELTLIAGIVNDDPSYYISGDDTSFYVGRHSTEMVKSGQVNVSVVDNPVAENIDQTEIVIDLVDSEGNPKPFEQDVSLELYTNGNETNYDSDVYQRVTFLAGETSKRVDLNVSHGDVDNAVQIGARYGQLLNDSNVVDVVIKAKPKSTLPNDNSDSDSSSGSSGGAFGFAWLALLPFVYFRRQKNK